VYMGCSSGHGRYIAAQKKRFAALKQDIGIPELAFTSPKRFHFPPFKRDACFESIMQVIVEFGLLVPGDSVGLDLRLFLASHNLLLVPAGASLYTFVLPGVVKNIVRRV